MNLSQILKKRLHPLPKPSKIYSNPKNKIQMPWVMIPQKEKSISWFNQ